MSSPPERLPCSYFKVRWFFYVVTVQKQKEMIKNYYYYFNFILKLNKNFVIRYLLWLCRARWNSITEEMREKCIFAQNWSILKFKNFYFLKFSSSSCTRRLQELWHFTPNTISSTTNQIKTQKLFANSSQIKHRKTWIGTVAVLSSSSSILVNGIGQKYCDFLCFFLTLRPHLR